MTILVTGGAGFIGSNFIYLLLEERPDWRVVCVDALTYAANVHTLNDAFRNPHFVFYKEDIRSREGINAIFEKERPDVVVNEYESLKPLIVEDTALITSCFGVPALEQLFPDGHWHGHRLQWVCGDYKAGWRNQTLKKYPCFVRPIQQIAVLSAQKMLRLLAGDRSAATADYLPPTIEY